MNHNYYILEYSDICAVDIDSNASDIGRIFAVNHHETVFVTDTDKYLHGIITMGDFFRKAMASRSIADLMNKEYKRIDVGYDKSPDYMDIDKAASKIFDSMPSVKQIPVIGDGKMLYVVCSEKKGVLWDSLRESIIRRFLSETLLHRDVYKLIIEKAIKSGIKFTAMAAQDIMAFLFFHDKAHGFYVEIGAHNGYSGSTTYWAEQLGWNGICVEPQKELFSQLRRRRSCALYNYAVSDETRKDVEFYTFSEAEGWSGIADTMTAKHVSAANEYRFGYSSISKVDTITFNDMMKDFPDINHIDFISIDTEGHEMNVLRSIDFEKYTFGLMTVETKEDGDVVEYINSKGYKPLLTAGSDVVFVQEDYRPHLGSIIKPKRDMLRFEIHLCDHCNLNCKHCGHFSPIANERCVELNVFERDFRRLSELTGRKCEYIDLMGGEPLLHPKVTEIFTIARKYFDTKIRLVTNGILLASQPDAFWESCYNNRIIVCVSVYPVNINKKQIVKRAAEFGVVVEFRDNTQADWFYASRDITGYQDVVAAYRNCEYGGQCIFLEDGKLAQCGFVFLSRYFNEYFSDSEYKYDEPGEDDYIDIYRVGSIDEILDRFTRPIPFCRYCEPDRKKKTEWGLSEKRIEEWS